MKALILGDRFITNELLKKALEEAFCGTGIRFTYDFRANEWPLKPVEQNDEVREYCGPDDDLIPLVRDADIILTHTACITRRVIEASNRLKVIGAARGGPVNINVSACSERGIPVLYAPGRNSSAVAELTVGLILAETRSIVRAHQSLMRDRRWRGDLYVLERVGSELSASTVGLIGLGAIGRKVARILASFGSRILVYDPYVKPRQEESQYRFVPLDELLSKADIVSLHARYTPETRGMIGEREIGLMKRTAVLVNTARGELVDHRALYNALKSGRIAGAALDVFEGEPPPDDSPLYELENVTVTTHLGGASLQAAEMGARIAAEEVSKFITGKEIPKFCANPEVLTK